MELDKVTLAWELADQAGYNRQNLLRLVITRPTGVVRVAFDNTGIEVTYESGDIWERGKTTRYDLDTYPQIEQFRFLMQEPEHLSMVGLRALAWRLYAFVKRGEL